MQAAVRPRLESDLIHYSIEFADLDRHYFVVECRIDEPVPGQVFRMPSWIPGSYLLREFARHVVSIDAVAGDEPVTIEKIDKSAWRVAGARGPLTVRIVTLAHERSVRGAFLDRQRGFFNGTSVFLLPEGFESEPITLRVIEPDHPAAGHWRVATAMAPESVDDRGFGTYRAADYEELIDHPFEISDHARVEFEAAGVPHALVVAGRFDSDLDRVAADLRQLCESQIDFFGRPAPFRAFVFLGLAVGDGYGGLEHRASTSLIFSRTDLPKIGETGLPKNYQRFLGLCSHEYFHSWHIKRSKPAAFMPYRLDRRNHTTLLWVFEGITSYYQERFLLTSGLLGPDAYLRRLAEWLTRVYRTPGRALQSIARSSFDAWDSLYKPAPSSINTGISYYGKGALVALALDLKLRAETGGCDSLDDIVVALWRRYGMRGVGLEEDGFEKLAQEFTSAPLAEFFELAVRGTDDLDLVPLFDAIGLDFVLRPSSGPQDIGGTPANGEPPLALGAVTRQRDTGIGLEIVVDGGPAAGAGLSPGDILVAIDGFVVGENDLATRLTRYSAGDRVRIDYIRDGVLLATELELTAPAADTCYIAIREGVEPPVLERRRGWLGA